MVSFTCVVEAKSFFRNAYSYVRIRATPPAGGLSAGYAVIPLAFANDMHVQRVFEPVPGTQPAGSVVFDIYFPRLSNQTSLGLRLYPVGTDPKSIGDDTPFFPLPIPIVEADLQEGSALLLGLENKEKNVRVLQTSGSAVPTNQPPASYTWTATILPAATAVVQGAIAHVTDLYASNLIRFTSCSQAGVELRKYFDPQSERYHLYFLSGADGKATLLIRAGAVPCWGHLIYWPFADNASEVARIVIYNPNIMGQGLFGPVPDINPATISRDPSEQLRFTILNDATPPVLNADGKIYYLVNDSYEKTVPGSMDAKIKVAISTRFVEAGIDNPASNSSRCIFVKPNGDVLVSPKYSFFVLRESSDSTILSEKDMRYPAPRLSGGLEAISRDLLSVTTPLLCDISGFKSEFFAGLVIVMTAVVEGFLVDGGAVRKVVTVPDYIIKSSDISAGSFEVPFNTGVLAGLGYGPGGERSRVRFQYVRRSDGTDPVSFISDYDNVYTL